MMDLPVLEERADDMYQSAHSNMKRTVSGDSEDSEEDVEDEGAVVRDTRLEEDAEEKRASREGSLRRSALR